MKELIVARNPVKKRRSAAQKRATAKMVAANRSRRSGGSTKRRRNPARKKTTSRRRARPASRRRAPARRRNPVGGIPKLGTIVERQIMPAVIGGSGAVANDVLYNFLPLPAMFAVGPMRHVGKAGSAIALAWLSSFFLSRRNSEQIGAGALTVVGYNVVRELVQRFAPQIQMGEYLAPNLGYYGAGMDPGYGVGEYLTPGIGQIPGTGLSTRGQLTQGTPYLAGYDYESEAAGYDYEM